jgi:hypothetical protein
MRHKNNASLDVDKNQIKKNQGQIDVLLENMSFPRSHFSGRDFSGYDQKKYRKQSLDQKVDEKNRGLICHDVLLSKKTKPDRDFLRKPRVGIKGHYRCRAQEDPITNQKQQGRFF